MLETRAAVTQNDLTVHVSQKRAAFLSRRLFYISEEVFRYKTR